MDGLKSDSETELTSTMGNALSVTNKDEKNDTNDATPTSSTDASTASTASRIVSDDPISSTSSDTVEQTKASEMNQSVTDLLENIPSERITEDVEDLVHDLESLLGESTDSFSIPIRTPPEELKDTEDIVSQTSGELNVGQEEQPAMSCEEETHSEDTTVTLDTSSICDVSAEVSEELGLSGSSTKIETDITSSETCVENVKKCDDTNVSVLNVPSQTTSNKNLPLEKEIQLAQDTQGIQEVEKRNIEGSDSEVFSKLFSETERPKVEKSETISDSGDTTDLEDKKTKEEVDKTDEHGTDKRHESKSGETLEAEGEEELSSQTCTEKSEHLEEIESTNEEEGNSVAVDEGNAKQNVISTPEIEMVDDSGQESENKTATDDGTSEVVDDTKELKDRVIVRDSNSLECAQKITENSELSTEIPESTCFVEETQKTVEITQSIYEDTNEEIVEDSLAQDSKYSEESCQSESPKKNVEQEEDEGVISTTKLTLQEIPVATVSDIQNETVSEIIEVVPETSEVVPETSEVVPKTSEVTMSGCTEASVIEEPESEAVLNEEIEPMTEISSGINPSPEDASNPMRVTGEDSVETVSTHPNLPETIDSSNTDTSECSAHITTSITAKCEDVCRNMDSECAAPSPSSEITAIADETAYNKDIKKASVVVEENFNQKVEKVEPEADYAKVEHIGEAQNQPSTCTEQESKETEEVGNVQSSEEITNTGRSISETTESNNTKESANEPLEDIVNQAKNEEYSENKTDGICAEQVMVEESPNSEGDDYEGDMPLIEAEAEAEPTVSDSANSDIPQKEIIEAHQTDENITQIEKKFDGDTIVETPAGTMELKDDETDLPRAEIISDESIREVQESEKINEKATSMPNNKEDIEVAGESIICPAIFNNIEKLEVEMKVDPKMETGVLSPDGPIIQEGTIIDKPEMDLEQLAESSGIIEELAEEKLNDKVEQEEKTSVEDSTILPIKNESTLKVDDISSIDGNEVEETKDEVEKEVEAESLIQPDSTQTIEKIIDSDENTTMRVSEAVVEKDIEDSESSEDSVDNQRNDDVQATIESISDDESSPAESEKTTEVSRDSFEKNSNNTEGESKPPIMKQLEFAPLVLSEEDSEEEAVPTQVVEPNDSIVPQENIEDNYEDSEELPQIEEILENQPVYIEPTASSLDMQENLETILAVASLQKIDIPKVTEPEMQLSEKERNEMEALRRAVESITDNSADAYVEEVEELINIPMLDSNVCDVASDQPVFMEDENEGILKSEEESIVLQKEDESAPDEGLNLIPVEEYHDTDQIQLVDSSATGYEVVENDQRIDEDTINSNKQNLETPAKNDIIFPQDIEQSNVDLNTPKVEQNVSSSMEVEAASEEVNSGHVIDNSNVPSTSTSEETEVEAASEEVNSGHVIDNSNVPSTSTSEEKEVEIRDDIENISGPKGDDLVADNLEVNRLESDPNVEQSNDVDASQTSDEKEEIAKERKATQKVDVEEGTEMVPDVQEREISQSMEDMKDSEIVPEVGELQGKEDTQIMDESESIETVPEVGQLQERHTTQTLGEKVTETVSEVGKSQEKEATQTLDKEELIKTVSEVGQLQERQTIQTVEGTDTAAEVGETLKKEATQAVDDMEGTATISGVGESHVREATQTVDEMEGTETVPEVGESQKRESTEIMDENQANESKVGESQECEAIQTVDEMEATETVPEDGEPQKIEAIETVDEKKTTETEVGEIPNKEAIQKVEKIKDTKTLPEVGESQKREGTETMDEQAGVETVSEVEELQKREATQTMDETEVTETVLQVDELPKREATQIVDEKQDTKTVLEVDEPQKRESIQTVDEKEGTEIALDELHKSEATEKIGEKKSTRKVPEAGELQEKEVTQAVDEKEGAKTVSEESQVREATQKIDVKTFTHPVSEVGESKKMVKKKGVEPAPDPEVVESQESEAALEVNEEKGTETDPDAGESQEKEASRKVNDRVNIEVDPAIGRSQEREATQKEDHEESTSTDPDNEESQEREASQKEDNETDPDIGESQEREATQKVDESKIHQRRTGLRNSLPEQETLIDSSQVITENEAAPAPAREKEVKTKANERPKRHKKSDNKLEELSINVDVPDREKPYSPKITIKPIKVPDEEVSTTSNSETEVTKGSLKMTITKQSDKLHSVLKVCDSENPESTTDMEEPIPKLIIKPKAQQMEQQHSPKMSTRSSNQRSLSPRITIKPVVKPEKQEALSPLKIKIGLKSDETPKKHSSKASARSASKQEEDSPRKVLIKPVVKSVEENEPIVSPRITIKPIPKPEAEKELVSRVNIKAIRKQDEENDEKERSSPKITIKPVVKPQEIDSHPEEGEEVKERIVLKINKGNLPTPTKDSKKREHPPDDEKSEKLAKITVKFSKGGGHPHIVQQMEEVHKRPHEEPSVPEKNKKQKVDAESTMSTRSRHKEVAVEAPVETKSRHKEHAEGSDFKSKLKDIENPQFESTRSSKHKDLLQESPIEAKRIKLKDSASDFAARQSRRSSSRSRQKDTDNAEDVQIVEPKLNSPIVISEDSRSQDSGSVILVEDSREEFSLNLTSHGLESPKGTSKSDSVVSTPSTTPTPRKRGRPRKVPIEVREEFKEQEEPSVKSKPKQQEEEEPSLQQSAPESGRPKRSCRGPSVCDRLGIKPRKPRGPGRGRGGKRGMGTRTIPMKPEKVPKLTKAKLKLMQKAAQDEAEAKKAFGKNPQGSAEVDESADDVIIVEAEDIKASSEETRKNHKSKVDSAESEETTTPTSDTKNKSDISEPEDSKASETKKKIKSKVFKKLALQKAVGNKQKSVDEKIAKVESCTDVEKDVPVVKRNPQDAHSTENNPKKSTDVQKKLPNLSKSLETEHKQGDSTETNIVTEQISSNIDIEQNPVIKEKSVVESSKLVLTDESAPVKTVIDEKEKRVSLKEKDSLQGEQVSLELKKELLATEDISLEVKTELFLANETPDAVDVSLIAEEHIISLEEVSFKLEDKDIDIETKPIELCKDAGDVAVDVEDEIPYSILAPPGSTSSKVFPGLAHGTPSVQPLLATSQKPSNPEHSPVTSTSGPSEIVMVDEETRMSADTSSRAQTPAKQMVAPADMSIEESQSSVHSTATTESGKTPSSRPSKAPRLEVQEADNNIVTAELISEYYWNGNGPFMIQEQVAQFLGIKSFKRKYPGIARRMVEMQERDFIREKGLASENMCDLGLTVVNSADILDIMYSDFQEKYEEYCKHQRDRQAKEMIDKQRAMNLAASQEKNKADITEQAVQSAAQWNARFNKTRKDQRRTCMDLQTLTVHYPKGRIKQINKVTTGNYPVALVPGQFTDFYEEFTPTEINNLPLNTMCYEPVTFIPREESEDSGSDGSESDSDSSDSSSSGSNSDSSSGVEDCKLCTKHSPKRAVTPK